MMQSLPSLNALRAFESAARHLSFSKAAEELNVTPAAISHPIRTLEESSYREKLDQIMDNEYNLR